MFFHKHPDFLQTAAMGGAVREYPGLPLCGPSDCPAECPRYWHFKDPKTGAVDELALINATMRHVWARLPAHPPPAGNASTPLILVTPSFRDAKGLQGLRLQHCATVLRGEPNVLWMVVEDAAAPSEAVATLLAASGVAAWRHLAVGPTRAKGHAQRNLALRTIRDERLRGVVYFMDDDNAYHPSLFNELRRVGKNRVGVLAVRRAIFPPPRCDGVFRRLVAPTVTRGAVPVPPERIQRIERPIYSGRGCAFQRFEAGWCRVPGFLRRERGMRSFCLDMGGFAFDARLLRRIRGDTPWAAPLGRGGESELIERLLPGGHPADLQPLANAGRDVLVFHNEWRTVPFALRQPTARACGSDGWGNEGTAGVDPSSHSQLATRAGRRGRGAWRQWRKRGLRRLTVQRHPPATRTWSLSPPAAQARDQYECWAAATSAESAYSPAPTPEAMPCERTVTWPASTMLERQQWHAWGIGHLCRGELQRNCSLEEKMPGTSHE